MVSQSFYWAVNHKPQSAEICFTWWVGDVSLQWFDKGFSSRLISCSAPDQTYSFLTYAIPSYSFSRRLDIRLYSYWYPGPTTKSHHVPSGGIFPVAKHNRTVTLFFYTFESSDYHIYPWLFFILGCFRMINFASDDLSSLFLSRQQKRLTTGCRV